VHTYELPYRFHHFGEVWSRISFATTSGINYLQYLAKATYENDGYDVDNDAAADPSGYMQGEDTLDAEKTAGTVTTAGTVVTGVGTAFALLDVGKAICIAPYTTPRFIAGWTSGTVIAINKALPSDVTTGATYAVSPPPRKNIVVHPKPSVGRTLRIPYIGRLVAPATDGDYIEVPEDLQWMMIMWTMHEFHVLEQDEAAANRVWSIVNRLLQLAVRRHSDSKDVRELKKFFGVEKRLVR
jgi:hypothetical protein